MRSASRLLAYIDCSCIWVCLHLCCFRYCTSACWTLPTCLSSWRVNNAAGREPTNSNCHPGADCWSPSSKCHSHHVVPTCNYVRWWQCYRPSNESSSSATDDVTPRIISNDTQVAAASKPRERAHVTLSETAPLQLQTVLQWPAEASLLSHITPSLLVIG